MGYSSRYHAASLIAVFIALAIGILIGVGLADDVVSTTSQELEESLRSNLDEAEQRADDLDGRLDRELDFGRRVYPALVSERLPGASVAVIAFGGRDRATTDEIEAALTPAGAQIEAIGVIDEVPDRSQLARAAGKKFSAAATEDEALQALGLRAGVEVAGSGPLMRRIDDVLFSEFSGSLDGVEYVVVVNVPAGADEEATDEEKAEAEALMSGMLEGIRRGARGAAGAERVDQDPDSVGVISEAGIPTVDHIDLTAGKVALVFSLLGASGDFGTDDGTDSFLPELLPAGDR